MAETQSAPTIPSEWGAAVAANVAKAIRDACGVEADKYSLAADEIDGACDEAVKAALQVLAEAFVIPGDVLAAHPTTLTEAVAAARAEGVREGLERAADICRLWDGPEIIPAVKAVLSDVELDIARRTAGGIADAICALITALPAPARAEGWQPIETAPKDGTDVILWAEAWEMSWGVQIGRFEGGEWHTAEGSVAENDDDFDRNAEVEFDDDENADWDRNSGPTHWQPLPAPPTTPGGRTDG